MKTLKTLMGLLMAVSLVGCTSTRQIAEINGVQVHRVTVRSAFAPNLTMIVTANTNTPGKIDFPVQASGPALASSIVSAAGGVGAATMLGHSMRPDKQTINAQGGGGGFAEGGAGGDSQSQGGSSYATGGQGGTGGQGYSSSGSTSSSASQSGSYSESSSWSGVIGSANNQNVNKNHNNQRNGRK